MATSLRAQAQTQTHQPQQSPTSSTSSVTTTPTSPHFHTHQRSQSSLARPLVGNGNGPYGHVYAQPGTRPSTAPTIHHPRPVTPTLFRPPANLQFATYLKSWGNDEIIDFLSIYNCAHHAGSFQKNDIDGKCILDLDTNNLKEMGVVKVGERIKIHNGIKDLRRRAANSGPLGISRVELRLNGAATPPLEDVPSSSPGLDGLYTRDNHPGSGMRRLGSSRPPPLDLHSQQSRNNLPLAYQNVPNNLDPGATTPRQVNVTKDGHPVPPPGPSRNTSSNSTASNLTITPSQVQASLVPAPAPATRQAQINTNHLNLRAPPSRDPGRRSPSPVNTDPTQFIDRPLPPAPNQSSAAEYASAIRYGEGRTTPTWGPGGDHQQGSSRAQAPNSDRRNHPPPIIVRQDMSQHRKAPSLGNIPGRSYIGPNSRPGTTGSAIHPFAASTTIREDDTRGNSPDSTLPPPMVSHSSNGSAGSGRSNRNAGYVVGTAGPPMHRSASVISSPHGSTGRRDQPGSGSGTLSLEDLRKQLVKFINSEDGTTRTVNLSQCTSGVEVLERALKKFGKWGTGTAATTDTESDEDGDQLEIDGWGVYEELEYHEDCECLLLWRSWTDIRRAIVRSCSAKYLLIASRWYTRPRWRSYPPTYPKTSIPKEHGSFPWRSSSCSHVSHFAQLPSHTQTSLWQTRQQRFPPSNKGDEQAETSFHSQRHVWSRSSCTCSSSRRVSSFTYYHR